MDALDPVAEWQRLSELYRRMSDNELLVLARQSSELTDTAQQALAQEVSQRGLKLQPSGSASSEGGAPGIDTRRFGRAPSRGGIELNRPQV